MRGVRCFLLNIGDSLSDLWNHISITSDNVFWLVILLILLCIVLVFKKKIVELKPDIKLSKTIIVVVFIVIVFVVAILMKSISSNESIHPILQVLLLSVSAFLTFMAFWVQYQFNLKQHADINRDRFESKFYRNLELFMDVEKQCDIPKIGSGKRAFHFMFYEYKAIISQILSSDTVGWISKGIDACKNNNNNPRAASDYREGYWKNVQQICYNVFISGVSTSAKSRLYEDCGLSEEEVSKINQYLLDRQWVVVSPHYLDDYSCVGVRLYDGHRLHLVPFFRNACLVVDYVVKEIRPDFDAIYQVEQTKAKKNKKEETIEQKSEEEMKKEKDAFAEFMKKNIYILSFLSLLSEHEISLLYIMYLYSTDEHHIFIDYDKKNLEVFFEQLLPSFIMAPNMHPNTDERTKEGNNNTFDRFMNVEKVISLREKDEDSIKVCVTPINETSVTI